MAEMPSNVLTPGATCRKLNRSLTPTSLNPKINFRLRELEKDGSEFKKDLDNLSIATKSTNMATAAQLIKEIGLLLTLNILLPSVDVYSDLLLIIKFLMHGHYSWAVILLVPFLLNYVFAWILWWRLDKNKRISWVASLLGCYPQWYAASVIRVLWKDYKRGIEKKMKMERNISEFEVFLESVFTVLGMTYIYLAAITDAICGDDLVYGEDAGLKMLAYATSILTASLGLAKCLKNGPCRVLGEGGALGGLCSGPFLLLMLSVGVTLVGKGFVAFLIGWILGGILSHHSHGNWPFIISHLVSFSTMFLPGFLLGLISVCRFKESLKTVLSYPSLLLMSVFTHFTFTANLEKGANINKEKECTNDIRITFSKKWTLINIVVSTLPHIVIGVGVIMMRENNENLGLLYFMYLILPMLGMLTTMVFLFDRCRRCCCCCCSCCCNSTDFQKAVLCVNDPLTEYVKDRDTKVIVTYQDWTRNKTQIKSVA